MARDGVVNVVERLRDRGFDPRRVGDDSWVARCPARRSADHALAISRNEFNHVVLECRSADNCPYDRIIAALGFTNDHVYAETPDWLIGRWRRVQIQGLSQEVLVLRSSSRVEAVEIPERQGSLQVLSRLASSARLFRSAEGRFCAQVSVNDRLEIHGLMSAGFSDWLIDGYLAGRAEPPSGWAIRRVVGMLAQGPGAIHYRSSRGLRPRRPRERHRRLALFPRPRRSQRQGRRHLRSRLVDRRSIGRPLPSPRGISSASGTGSRRLNRSAAPLRQSLGSGFPPHDCLVDGGPPAGGPLPHPVFGCPVEYRAV